MAQSLLTLRKLRVHDILADGRRRRRPLGTLRGMLPIPQNLLQLFLLLAVVTLSAARSVCASYTRLRRGLTNARRPRVPIKFLWLFLLNSDARLPIVLLPEKRNRTRRAVDALVVLRADLRALPQDVDRKSVV